MTAFQNQIREENTKAKGSNNQIETGPVSFLKNYICITLIHKLTHTDTPLNTNKLQKSKNYKPIYIKLFPPI